MVTPHAARRARRRPAPGARRRLAGEGLVGRRAGPRASAIACARKLTPSGPARPKACPHPPRLTHHRASLTRTQATTAIRASLLPIRPHCSKLPQFGRKRRLVHEKANPLVTRGAQSDGTRRVGRATERTREGIFPHAFQDQKDPPRDCRHWRDRSRRGSVHGRLRVRQCADRGLLRDRLSRGRRPAA